MDRREFLNLRHRLQEALPQPPADSANPLLLRCGRRAMATSFEVLLPFDTPRGSEAAAAALDLIDQLEDQLTVYRDHSEVSQLNARAALEPVSVERNLFDLFTLARQLHLETERAFDIATGALTQTWGFYARAGRVPAPDEIAAALERTGMQHVALDPQQSAVSFTRPGIEINLGSIGKGYALDRVTQLLCLDWNIASALVHAGHSSIFALGGGPGGDAWPIALSDPSAPERTLGTFHLRDRALGTSSATYQHLMHEGRKLGHILDLRTGWPAEGMLSATVTAPTAALADALATAFFILGPESARRYCQAHAEIGAVLIEDMANGRPIVLGQAGQEFDNRGRN